MPNFLSDPPQLVYILLAGLLVVSGAIAAQKQDRRAVIPFGVAFLLMMLVFLMDRFSESPREEAVRRVHMMAMAADAKSADAFVEHLADKVTVQTAEGQTKTATRDEFKQSHFWSLLKQWNVHVAVWDFSREDVKVIDDKTIEIGFMAKGEADGKQVPLYAKATFGKQGDGTFKLTAFKSFEPIDRTKPFPITNFP